MKIGILIPTTSYKRDEWKYVVQSYLYTLTIKTFLDTYDIEHEYVFYIGIDKKDRLFDNSKSQQRIYHLVNNHKNINIKFIYLSQCKKGYLTAMWNVLFKTAYDELCDYFYQCGDDIHFKTKGWINACIETLQKHSDIGLTGPINNNNNILTQAFVSRKHMDIFGFLFSEELINWGCDDWYNTVYKPCYFYPLKDYLCTNEGGEPRYIINNNPQFRDNYYMNVTRLRNDANNLAIKHRNIIEQYISSHNIDKSLFNESIMNLDNYINQKKSVFSFCLYGKQDKYCKGMINNLTLINKYYPTFYTYIYIADDVPSNIVEAIKSYKNVILIQTPYTTAFNRLERFKAIDNEDVDIMIVRDADSRIHARDRSCINDFIASPKLFHIVRDHPYHTIEILAGMWGIKKGLLKIKINELITHIMKQNDQQRHIYHNNDNGDQIFLKTVLYPIVKNNCLIHDEFIRYEKDGCEKIPIINNECNRTDTYFVGATYLFKGNDEYLQEKY